MSDNSGLYGLSEAAEFFGVSKQVLSNWRKRDVDFPEPQTKLKQGPIWTLEQLCRYSDIRRGRKL